jgi:hypothetical protein
VASPCAPSWWWRATAPRSTPPTTAGRGTPLVEVSGSVRFAPSGVPARARVTLHRDVAGDGTLGADDFVVTYFDTDGAGGFAGSLPAGEYLVRADVPDLARSPVVRLTVGSAPVTLPALELPDPARVDFTVVDDEDGRPVPARLTVLGRHPVPRDFRVNQTAEGRFGILRTVFSVHGTSVPDGEEPGDAPLLLPAGGPYRLYVSRGPERSIASVPLTLAAGERVTLPPIRLRRVLDTTGYVATAFHEHALSSPDSPVPHEDRLASLLVEGIEFFAGTDHDRLFDYDPLIDAFGVRGLIDAVVGIESTPFAYGHFKCLPAGHRSHRPDGRRRRLGPGARDRAGHVARPDLRRAA